MPQDKKRVFRIANLNEDRGLWYNPKGTFTGEVHEDLSFCRASAYKMPFDEKLSQVWRSATNTPKELLVWFNLEELEKLEKHGYFVALYATSEYKTHTYVDPDSGTQIEHLIFKIDASELIELVNVEKFKLMLEE